MEQRLDRVARNEALFREANERIRSLSEAADVRDLSTKFHCECGRDGCAEWIWMTPSEYEPVRSQDDRFVVFPGHETSEVEHVVDRNERFLVVDKVPAAEPFVSDDPRGAKSH